MAADEEIVGFHDLFDIMVDEVIKRINVLLHQSSHPQEGGEELELIDGGFDGRGERLGGRDRVIW